MNKLFIGKNFVRVDFIFTGYYSLRFFTEEKFEWINQVSPDVERKENRERINFLKSLILDEDASEAFKRNWKKFVFRQTSFFYELHPTCYKAGKTLKGWETRKLVKGFFILCPKKLIFPIWRSYDSKEVIYGKLLDKFTVDGETTFVVVPENQPLLFSDYIQPKKGHIVCSFLRGELVAYATHNRAWYMAEIAPPVVEEFLD